MRLIGHKNGAKTVFARFSPHNGSKLSLLFVGFRFQDLLSIVGWRHSELFFETGSEIFAVAVPQRNGNLVDVAVLVLQLDKGAAELGKILVDVIVELVDARMPNGSRLKDFVGKLGKLLC